jgi:Xaa-Pro dipeptidase
LNLAVYALAEEMFGISKYWHKRIVRAGKNTLAPYDESLGSLVIKEGASIFSNFPHKEILGSEVENYIHPDDHQPL